jgi:hypothetical protein
MVGVASVFGTIDDRLAQTWIVAIGAPTLT